jgi:hypothetical protein
MSCAFYEEELWSTRGCPGMSKRLPSLARMHEKLCRLGTIAPIECPSTLWKLVGGIAFQASSSLNSFIPIQAHLRQHTQASSSFVHQQPGPL